MNPETALKLRALSQCVFQVASWNKRFVRDLATLGAYDLLSPRQEACVHRFYWRYRRQIWVMRERHPEAGYPEPIEPEKVDGSLKIKTDSKPLGITVRNKSQRTWEALAKLDEWNKKVGGLP